jgi:hypothetical protein
MSDLEQQAQKGQQAERILNDEVFKESIAKVEAKYLNQWRSSQLDAGLQREKAYLLLRALSDVLNEIQVVIDGGAVAKATMQRSQRKG